MAVGLVSLTQFGRWTCQWERGGLLINNFLLQRVGYSVFLVAF